jgi:hypothetical protein
VSTWEPVSERLLPVERLSADTLDAASSTPFIWSDLVIDTIHGSEETLSVLIERVVSVHILEMRSTTAHESLRALRELRPELVIIPTLHVAPDEFAEAQSVHYSLLGRQRPRPVFVPGWKARDRTVPAPGSALTKFLNPLAHELEGEPEETWPKKALAHFGAAEEKSQWADKIGLLYSLAGTAAALGISRVQLRQAADTRLLLALESSEGELLFPAGQLRQDGKISRGIHWILGQLDDEVIDRYTLAAWLNQRHEDLDDLSVWDVMRDSESLPNTVRALVAELRASISQ